MTLLYTPGVAGADVAAISRQQRITERLSAFGDDLIGFWCPNFSPVRLPGVTRLGDPVDDMLPVVSRRDTRGEFPRGFGRGAAFDDVAGLAAIDCSTTCPRVTAQPVNRNAFGIGALVYLSQATLDVTIGLFGNDESGGGKSSHILRRSNGSSVDQTLTWGGISSSWYGGEPAAVKERAKITAPGWYILSADSNGGAEPGPTALAIDNREPVVGPSFPAVPTMSEINFGGLSAGTPCLGGVTAMLVCDGPLVQDASRLAQWIALATALKSEIKV